MGQFQNRSLAYRHGFLHDRHRNAAPVLGTSLYSTLSLDDRFHGLTTFTDVTQDHANTRAGSLQWQIGLAGAAFHPLQQHVSTCFFETLCGRKAGITSAK